MSEKPTPPMTPLEASVALATDGRNEIEKDGWTYYWDGPMRSPPSDWWPVADHEGRTFVPTGDLDTEITRETEWLCVDDL